jgi:hypothetical protein
MTLFQLQMLCNIEKNENEWWVGKDLEGGIRSLFRGTGTIPAFTEETEENQGILSGDSQ